MKLGNEKKPENCAAFEAMVNEYELPCEEIGIIRGDSFIMNNISMDMQTLKDNYFNTFKKVIERDI